MCLRWVRLQGEDIKKHKDFKKLKSLIKNHDYNSQIMKRQFCIINTYYSDGKYETKIIINSYIFYN